ncbi:MAG: MBOAT family protein [Kofleriaceae bacterium]|nr:MBOAT family protein [Kofleriaceae bacterium]
MLFSNPDYPVFLIAVFFLYVLARVGDARGWLARAALMILLGDIVFMLVAKEPDALWDPVGGIVLRLATFGGSSDAWDHWSLSMIFIRWPIGLAAVAGAVWAGRRGGTWLSSDAGQRVVARGIVGVLAVVALTVAIAHRTDSLDAVTAWIAAHGHLLVLAVLGLGIGLARDDGHRALGRIVVLFVASSLFYHAWAAAMPGPYRYLLALLLGTIILDYYLAIWIENCQSPQARKLLVVVSLVSNLGILFFFKYADFVTHDVLDLPVKRLHLILPAGISFHTFQSLSYTIDVYRKQLRATRSPIKFATFVLFFPQLVAGPIVRAQDLLPQLDDLPALELEKATRGLFRIVVGLFKKVALADTLALVIVDRVFDSPGAFSAVEVLAGVYGYALQIYLDFSAYSDIAIGSAAVLGFELPENFRTPYRSANLQEFWRRWHISLSTWLRDYLYVTLGGNRLGAARTYLNLILTMVLGGLWHGASWAFIVWGALHGFGLAVTRYFQRATAREAGAAWRLLAGCALLALAGLAIQTTIIPDDTGTWWKLVIAWLYLTPLWAVATAWLGREPAKSEALPLPAGIPWRALWPLRSRIPPARLVDKVSRELLIPELLRIGMCASGVVFLVALQYWDEWTWIPLVVVTWGLALAADLVERGPKDLAGHLRSIVLRGIAVFLVFNYVCLAWIFFRAESFDAALAILRQLGSGQYDSPNIVPLVTTALAVGFATHFFADGSFRWMRERFAMLPAWAQGGLLAAAALVLRELGHAKVVPFIYFQF